MNNYLEQTEVESLPPDTFEHDTFLKTIRVDRDRHQVRQGALPAAGLGEIS
jgi:hypothetical protein